MIPWLLPVAMLGGLWALARGGQSSSESPGSRDTSGDAERLPVRHNGTARPRTTPIEGATVRARMLYPWHLRSTQTASRSGSRSYPVNEIVELVARGTLRRGPSTMYQVRVVSDNALGYAFVLPDEIAAGAGIQSATPAAQPAAPATPAAQPAAPAAPAAQPAAPAAAPRPAAAPITAAQVAAAQRATLALGRASALGTPSAAQVRETQTSVGYTPADGQFNAAYRAHLARLLASQGAEAASPPRDERHRYARQLAAYILTQRNPNRDTIMGFQRRLGVSPTGQIDLATARAIETQFNR